MKRLIVGLCAFSVLGFADEKIQPIGGPTLEKVRLSGVFVPIGFDNINKVQITVEGALANTCYKVGPHKVEISDGNVVVTQGAHHYQGTCTDALVPFSQVIDLGIVPTGTYSIIDGSNGRKLGELPIKDAPHKSPSTYPDDYLYAPVSDASLIVEGSRRTLVLTGTLTDDCTKMREIRFERFGNVLQVLPITDRPESGCHRLYRPFQIVKDVNIPDGHYLLHVRALSGNAINKVVDAYNF